MSDFACQNSPSPISSPETSRLHARYSTSWATFSWKTWRQRTDIHWDTVRRSWMLRRRISNPHLLGRFFVNIGSLEPYDTSKCRLRCRLSFAESRRWYKPGILFHNTIECRGTLVSWWELFFFVLFPTWSVLRPSVGSTNSAKSSTRRAVRSGERERERERDGEKIFIC